MKHCELRLKTCAEEVGIFIGQKHVFASAQIVNN